jgi:hypothetical protein
MSSLGQLRSYLVGDGRSSLLRRMAIMTLGDLFNSITTYVIDTPECIMHFFNNQNCTRIMKKRLPGIVCLFMQAQHPSRAQPEGLGTRRRHQATVSHSRAATSLA